MNEKAAPTLELISGAYSSVFWSEIEDWFEGEDNPRYIYNALNALYECGKNQEAYELIRVLYDMVGLTYPIDAEEICKDPDNCKRYIAELLMDIEDMI